MIVDHLENANLYTGLGQGIVLALEYLRRAESLSLEPPGFGPEHALRQPIDGDAVFALVQRYDTKLQTAGFWEAHRRHIDVQFVVEGVEAMGYAPLAAMRIDQPYDQAKDFLVAAPVDASTPCSFVSVKAGMFAIFMPQDAHMPGIALQGVMGSVKKIVVKVRVD